jgi:hypothetical protein
MANQRFKFDKFMKNIIKKEQKDHNVIEETRDNPAREYRKLYSERWQNRVVWRGGKNRA